MARRIDTRTTSRMGMQLEKATFLMGWPNPAGIDPWTGGLRSKLPKSLPGYVNSMIRQITQARHLITARNASDGSLNVCCMATDLRCCTGLTRFVKHIRLGKSVF